MKSTLEETIIEVWRQALVENATAVVDFAFEGNEIRGLEQNPDTRSRWAQMARSGKKVMQFLSEGRYLREDTDAQLFAQLARSGSDR